jgi:hypothetical protein
MKVGEFNNQVVFVICTGQSQWRLSKLVGHCMGEEYTPISYYDRGL